jgi:hypothetical protein
MQHSPRRAGASAAVLAGLLLTATACGSSHHGVAGAPPTTVSPTQPASPTPTPAAGEPAVQAPPPGPAPAPVGRVFDVTSYGADPTGSRDSTAAIRAAIAAAEAGSATTTVYFPAGRYLLDDDDGKGTDLTVSGSHPLDILGAGATTTTVVEKVGTATYPDLKRGKNAFDLAANGSYFSGLTVDVRTYNAGDALDDNADDTTIENSTFLGSRNGSGQTVDPDNTFDLRVAADCNINPGHRGYGVFHTGNTVEDVTVEGDGTGGNDDLDFSCQHDGRIAGIIDDGWGTAIYIDQDVTVDGYTFRPAGSKYDRGFYVTDSSGITIDDFTTYGDGGVVFNRQMEKYHLPMTVTIDHEVMLAAGYNLQLVDTEGTVIEDSTLQVLKLSPLVAISGVTLRDTTDTGVQCKNPQLVSGNSGLAC